MARPYPKPPKRDKRPQKSLIRKRPIRYSSAKRSAQNRKYSSRITRWKEENPWCIPRISKDCTRRTNDNHHVNHREGEKLHDESEWLPVCRHCHRWIHEHPKESREFGWLK